MNPNQTFEQVDLHINDNDESWKDTRLTCEYDPLADVADPRFDFDALQEPDELPEMTRCRCDDSKPDPYLTCCNCGFSEYEYYGYRDKFSAYCNECALQVCGKLIEKPKYAFSRVPVSSGQFQCDFVYCDECNYMMLDQDKIIYNSKLLCSHCARDAELLDQYTEEQQDQLIKYAEKHNLTIEESIDYQTHCHCCGKTVEDGFDESNHQYCKEKCFERCEEYWYHCFRGDDCKVCGIWEYHARRDSLTAYDLELSELAPVLATIDCFKELKVYSQLYECIEDLVEYFDSDRQWRYDFV
jgi:hypothetical protein